jgi:hypothetical protein
MPVRGWYVDGRRPGYLRYWDGAQWTEARVPVLMRPAPSAQTEDDEKPEVVSSQR